MHMVGLITAFAAHRQAARVRCVATRELAAMSRCELSDMGITRLDVSRLFESRPVPGFRSRGEADRIAAAATLKPLQQNSAYRESTVTLA